MIGNEKLIVHAVRALYDTVNHMRPNWLDNEDTSPTIDAFFDGAKNQSRNGVVVMKHESYTFNIE